MPKADPPMVGKARSAHIEPGVRHVPRPRLTKRRPAVAPKIVGREAADRANDAELVAMARRYFDKHDCMAGNP
jgi:hypothetical protein